MKTRKATTTALGLALGLFISIPAGAGERGVSFWVPGQLSSSAVAAGEPRWSLPPSFYLTPADLGGRRTTLRGGRITAGAELGRLANVGINHWSLDLGGGYTYLDPKNGHELSAVAGFTFNVENNDTDDKSAVDSHLDWAASRFMSKETHVGVAGYYYYQLTSASGAGARLGDYKSSVMGIGPQVGHFFEVGGRKWYVNVKGFYEFNAKNRPEGWNLWVSLAIPLRAGM